MLKITKAVSAIMARIAAAEDEIRRSEVESAAAVQAWRDAIEGGKAETAPLKRRTDAESAATAAREKLEILRGVLIRERRAAVPEIAADVETRLAAVNDRALEAAETLLSAWNAAEAAAQELRRLGADHDALTRAFVRECADLDVARPPIAEIRFAVERRELAGPFRVGASVREKLSRGRLLHEQSN